MRGRVLAVLAFIAYNSWLAWGLNGNPRVLTGYLSELAAQDQPYQWFFRLADVVAAGLFTVIAVLGRRGWATWLGSRAPQVAVALIVVAAGTALDAVFNLPCAESHDALCAATSSTVRHFHEVASVVVSVGLVAVIGLSAVGQAERGGWGPPARATAGLGVVVALLLVTSAVAPVIAPGTQGAVQAAQVLACSAWIGVLAWRLPGGERV